MLSFRFAYQNVLIFGGALLALISLYRWKLYSIPTYRVSFFDRLKKVSGISKTFPSFPLNILRFFLLFSLLLLSSRPQRVDSRHKVTVNGVDIVLAIDISGSMKLFDDVRDRRPRIEVAKSEAINFIDMREDDAIGVVVFGADSLSVCPLTLDKKMLKDVVGNLEIGTVDPRGTVLHTALATSVSRLRNSNAKSKIVVMLTDGQPQGESNFSAEQVIEIAKTFGVKVYTIGVGSEKGGYDYDAFGGIVSWGRDGGIDARLLTKIANETGGKFFLASNPNDLRNVYKTIDQLEKSERQTEIFSRYYEMFSYFILIAIFLLLLESILRFWLWRGVT